MKKDILRIFGFALALTTVACGSSYVPAPITPINSAQLDGSVLPGDPRANANAGPIDGEWNRSAADTTCDTGSSRGYISAYSFYIDNLTGTVLINYDSGVQLAVPATFSYPTTGKVQVSRGVGPINCKVKNASGALATDQGRCTSGTGYPDPILGMTIDYTVTGNSAKFRISSDPVCNPAGPSNATMTLTN